MPDRSEDRHHRAGLAPRLWSVAAAGNATALAIIAAVLVGAPALFELEHRPTSRLQGNWGTPRESTETARLLLVVVDALRLDTARDASLMPRLNRLAERGAEGVAIVDSLVPSTVAGIRVIATGVVPPPASFFEDFGAARSEHGGLLAAVRRHGGRSFVAGTHLWTDLYGAWIDEAAVVETLGEQDEVVLEAALEAVADDTLDLVVVHFNRCDDLAHRHGAFSQEYRDGARWCDAALGRLIERAPSRMHVLVTSDHGVTASGGHAGPEPDVRRVPVVVAGPGLTAGSLDEISQSDISALAAHFLGIPLEGPVLAPVHAAPDLGDLRLALLLLTVVLALAVFRRVESGVPLRWQSTLLDAALWTAVAVAAMLRQFELALALALLALFVVAVSPARDAPGSVRSAAALALLAGVALGAWRALDAWIRIDLSIWESAAALLGYAAWAIALVAAFVLARREEHNGSAGKVLRFQPSEVAAVAALLIAGAFLGGASLALVVVLGVLVGRWLGVASRNGNASASLGGVGLAIAVSFLAAASGESVSLSTTDVHLAFDRVDGPLGLPAALGIVFVRHALPTLALLVGSMPTLQAREAAVRARFLAAAGATLLGQAAVATCLLSPGLASPVAASLGVGALVRVICEMNFVFLGAATLLALAAGWRSLAAAAAPAFSRRRAGSGIAFPSTGGNERRSSSRASAPLRSYGD